MTEELVQEAVRIVDYFQKNNVTLRMLGATAFRFHCKSSYLFKALKRELTDLDFASYGRESTNVMKLMAQLGYQSDSRMVMLRNVLDRYIFENKARGYHADVFFDKLEMCHTIDFKGRLEIDYPTVGLAELLLEKLQIVQITEKDIKDLIVLLLEHKIGRGDKETINGSYIAEILSKNWGFYYTATNNLHKLIEVVPNYKVLRLNELEKVESQTRSLLNIIEKEPKSIGWKMRAKLGTKRKWYTEVESVS